MDAGNDAELRSEKERLQNELEQVMQLYGQLEKLKAADPETLMNMFGGSVEGEDQGAKKSGEAQVLQVMSLLEGDKSPARRDSSVRFRDEEVLHTKQDEERLKLQREVEEAKLAHEQHQKLKFLLEMAQDENLDEAQREKIIEALGLVEDTSQDEPDFVAMKELEMKAQAAQNMLEQVQQLRSEIHELNESKPESIAVHEQRVNALKQSMISLEKQRMEIEGFVGAAEQRATPPASSPPPLPASFNLPQGLNEEEVQQLMIALEQARELGRLKSLQLKRQEQELATLQRSIQSLEGRLLTVKPAEGSPVISEVGNGIYDGQSNASINVEAASTRSYDTSRARRIDSEGCIGEEEEEEEEGAVVEELEQSMIQPTHRRRVERGVEETSVVARAGSTVGTIGEEEEDDEDETATEENTSTISGNTDSGADSTGAVAGTSTVANLQSSSSGSRSEVSLVDSTPVSASMDAAVAAAAGGRMQDMDTSSRTSMGAEDRSGLAVQVGENLNGAGGHEKAHVALPSDRYLDEPDCRILLEDIHEFVDECRVRHRIEGMSDRDFGRRMVNFVSKLLNELAHVDISSLDQQRQVLRSLRRLSST